MNFPPAINCLGTAALALAMMFGAVSCTSPAPQPKRVGPPPRECYWKGDGVPGSPKIVISLSEQCVRYYKGGKVVGVSPISSGREGHSTRRGSFRVIEKDLDHRSTLYGAFVDSSGLIVQEDVDVRKDRPPPGTRFVGAEMPGFMRITGAIGMHGGYLPGYPASHGCIRLPGHIAHIFYHATPHGTPVEVVGHASEAPRHPPVIAPAPIAATEKTKAKQKKPEPLSRLAFARGGKKKKAPPVPRGQTRYLVE